MEDATKEEEKRIAEKDLRLLEEAYLNAKQDKDWETAGSFGRGAIS